MYYTGIKLDYDSWKIMCAKNPRVKVYSMVEDPTIQRNKDLFYFYGDINVGNIAQYINNSIYCRHKENVKYQLYPTTPPCKQDIVDSKEYGYIGIYAIKGIRIG